MARDTDHLKFSERESLRHNAKSIPATDSWKKFPCVLKCGNIKSFEQGLSIEKTLLDCVDTDAEETILASFKSVNTGKNKFQIIDRTEACQEIDNNINEIQEPTTLEATKSPQQPPPTTLSFGENTIINNKNTDDNEGLLLVDSSVSKALDNILLEIKVLKNDIRAATTEISNIKLEFKKVNVEYTKIMENLDKIFRIIGENAAKNNEAASKISKNITKEDLIQKYNFPLSTCEEITILNEDLKKDLNLKEQLIETLATIGGKNGQGTGAKVAYKIVDFLFKPEVLVNYSWTGVSREKGAKKQSFQLNDEIIEIFYTVILLADNRHTKQVNETLFKDGILKHAKKRCTRKKIAPGEEEQVKEAIVIEDIEE